MLEDTAHQFCEAAVRLAEQHSGTQLGVIVVAFLNAGLLVLNTRWTQRIKSRIENGVTGA